MFGLTKRSVFWIIGVTLFSTLVSAGITQLWYAVDSNVTRTDVLMVAIMIPMICAPICTYLGMKSRQKIVQLAQENERIANTDALTGLANRRAFFNHIEAAHTTDSVAPHAVTYLVCDVDNFKHFNDRHGHAVGDDVLVHVARLIKQAMPDRAYVARIGGEEFAIRIDCRADDCDANWLADRVVDGVSSEPLLRDGALLHVTLSVGVYVGTNQTAPARALFAADKAMYEAKANGRNQFVLAA